jgi:hypothetical protein
MGLRIVHQFSGVLDIPFRESVFRLLCVVACFFEIRLGVRHFKAQPTSERYDY